MSLRRAALCGALWASFPVGPAHASGRWYAWLDRVSPGQAEAAASRWTTRGVPVTRLPSERLMGVDAGFVYLIAAESLFQADAQAYVLRLQQGGFKGTGVQYFSDAVPAGTTEALGVEPVFAVDAEVDGVPPAEIVALTRGADGAVRAAADLMQVVDLLLATSILLLSVWALRRWRRARAFPLAATPEAGTAVVFEAGFDDARQASHWSLIFTFTAKDLRVAPKVFFVPGARSPVPVRVVFESTPEGLGYAVTVSGLKRGPQARRMVWRDDRFVDAASGCPTFSWSASPGASGFELAVLRLDRGEEPALVWRHEVEGSSSSARPSRPRGARSPRVCRGCTWHRTQRAWH